MQYLLEVTNQFFKSSPIRIEEKVEGNKIEGTTLILGCRAGPSLDVDNLLHEMAHLIEINDKRILSWNWGLQYPEVELLGRVFYEPNTIQGLNRELRVFAIQKHLFEICEISVSADYWEKKAKILEWLQDFYLIPTARENRNLWCQQEMEKLYKKYSKNDLLIEWDRKNQLLKNVAK